MFILYLVCKRKGEEGGTRIKTENDKTKGQKRTKNEQGMGRGERQKGEEKKNEERKRQAKKGKRKENRQGCPGGTIDTWYVDCLGLNRGDAS